MKVRFNKASNILSFKKFGQLHFQKGSLTTHKQNGVLDTDVIGGLIAYINEMNKNVKSRYNLLALGNLESAFVFLRLRRLTSYDQYRKNAQKSKSKSNKKVSKTKK